MAADETRFHCDRCAMRLSPTEPLAPGDLLDARYRVERPIGAGSNGSVWLARDVHLERRVAIKLALGGAGESFAREAATLAAIRHRNIVEVYAFGLHGSSAFFVMELVDGVSVDDIIQEHIARATHPSAHATTRILAQVADALGAAHARGLVHRDVKPGNIVIESGSGRPVLVDFGIATEMNRRISNVAGSPAYMAPETTEAGGVTGPLADQYSLAVTAFEMLTGHLPFENDGLFAMLEAHRKAPRPRVSSTRPELAALDAVIQRAMDVEPGRRFANSTAFARALEDAARQLEASAPVVVAPRADTPSVEMSAEMSAEMRAESGSLRVLVVDDDPVALRMLARAIPLSLPGVPVRVARATSGPEAIISATRALPQLLVLDFGLPSLDGVEVLSRIRTLAGGETVRVLVASGQVDAAQRYRFSVLGVSDFLSKPYDVTAVAASVDRLARRNGWLPELEGSATS